MGRQQLKQHAKGLIRSSKPGPIAVTCVFILISLVFTITTNLLCSKPITDFTTDYFSEVLSPFEGMSDDEMAEALSDENFMSDLIDSIDIKGFFDGLTEKVNLPIVSILSLLLSLTLSVINAGYSLFCLRTVDRSGASIGNLFDGFGMFLRIIWLVILQSILIFLWSLLFVIPGFIAFYRYRMAMYLRLEHPELSAMECIDESKRMMKGHKSELFVLDLSFIGWFLLIGMADYASTSLEIAVIGIGLGTLVNIYVLPFRSLSYATFYKQLRGEIKMVDDGFGGYVPEL